MRVIPSENEERDEERVQAEESAESAESNRRKNPGSTQAFDVDGFYRCVPRLLDKI